MKNVKIKIRYDCAGCKGTGKVRSYDTSAVNYSATAIKLYDKSYCPNCKGEKYLEEWVLLTDVLKET